MAQQASPPAPIPSGHVAHAEIAGNSHAQLARGHEKHAQQQLASQIHDRHEALKARGAVEAQSSLREAEWKGRAKAENLKRAMEEADAEVKQMAAQVLATDDGSELPVSDSEPTQTLQSAGDNGKETDAMGFQGSMAAKNAGEGLKMNWNQCRSCGACVVDDGVTLEGTPLVEESSSRGAGLRGGSRRLLLEQHRLGSDRLRLNSEAEAAGVEGGAGAKSTVWSSRDMVTDRRPSRGLLTTVSLDIDSPSFDHDNHLPRCEKCHGCSTELKTLDRTVKIGPHKYTNEPGASPASLFAASSTRAVGGWGVAKTWCFRKFHRNGEEYKAPPCDKNTKIKRRYQRMIARVEAMQALADECGIGDVTVRHWRERIRSSHPTLGDKINGDVLFMDRAPGVSLEMFTRTAPEAVIVRGTKIKPRSPHRLRHGVLSALDNKKVLRGALFDVLFGQCDRHGQNIFVTGDGEMTFIDNDQAYGEGWRRCAVDSVMIPGSEKFTIVRYGNNHVHGEQPPQKNMNIQVLLDYRCHAPGGKLGENYPPAFRRCAAMLRESSVQEIADRFGFEELKEASFVKKRARMLMEYGFEVG